MIDGLPKEKAEKKMNQATRLMAKALKSCHRLDYHMFEKQADILDEVSDRLDIDEEFMKHVFSEHGDELSRDAELWIREWKQGVPFNSGMFFGQFEKVFVDANEQYPPALKGSQRDNTAPAQFTAGWYYGISNEDERNQILECFTESEDLTNALYDAMEAYIAGDEKTGDVKMKETKALYKTAMAGCGQIAEAMGVMAKRLDDMEARQDWDKLSQEIYQANKDVIDRDNNLVFSQWSDGVFFNSGMFAGQIEKIFLDATPEAQTLAHYMFMTPF